MSLGHKDLVGMLHLEGVAWAEPFKHDLFCLGFMMKGVSWHIWCLVGTLELLVAYTQVILMPSPAAAAPEHHAKQHLGAALS